MDWLFDRIMQTPYEAPCTSSDLELRERKVGAYFVVASFMVLCAGLVAFPGLVLLNQELDWIPTRGRVFGVEYDGKPVPLKTAMRDSLLLGSIVLVPGVLLVARGLYNLRWNRKNFSVSKRACKSHLV